MSKKTKIVLLVIISLCIIVGIVVLVNKNNSEKNIEETNELRVQRDNENVDINQVRNEIEENMQKLKNNNA